VTRNTITTVLLAAVAVAPLVAQQAPITHTPWKARDLTFSQATVVAAIEGAQLSGEPSRLAWTPDGNLLYVQTIDGPFGRADSKLRHFLVASTGGALREMPAEPEWAIDYWLVKSDQASPDDPAVRIDLKSEGRRERTTSVPQGGDLARGGTSPAGSMGRNDAVDAAFNSQLAFMNTLLLYGQKIGEFDNTVIVPGLTFGWGPLGTKVIAYAETGRGRITVMDENGDRTTLSETRDGRLPAWSEDGTRLAWVERDGRGRYVIKVADVGRK